jgi:helicase MOV-10
MERVMSTDRYKANPEYNSDYVTQLLDNYRSHPAILKFSNELFYDSKLRAKNQSADIKIGSCWKKLPKQGFPLMFRCTKEPSAIEVGGTSSFNKKEAYIVQNYVKELLENGINSKKIIEDDIGVVTPYRAQLDLLKKILPKKVEIGTTEYFQGREKLIIIVSTVKSETGVGFLSNEKRLNVCITRAKSLLIIVGNAETLKVII